MARFQGEPMDRERLAGLLTGIVNIGLKPMKIEALMDTGDCRELVSLIWQRGTETVAAMMFSIDSGSIALRMPNLMLKWRKTDGRLSLSISCARGAPYAETAVAVAIQQYLNDNGVETPIPDVSF